jgi:putative phosphoribosyl transferase
MVHTHRFGIGDPGAVAALIEKLEAQAPSEVDPRLDRAIRTAEARAIELELSPGQEGERDLAFYHGLLTGYAVALRLAEDAACASSARGSERPVVAALLPGSVDAASRAAREMGTPLEVVAVRAVLAPGEPEVVLAAVTEGGFAVVDGAAVAASGIPPREIGERLARVAESLTRSVGRLRAETDPVPVRGRTVLVVTDRPASGLIPLAVERLFLERGAARVYVMSPAAGVEDALVEERRAAGALGARGGDGPVSDGDEDEDAEDDARYAEAAGARG